KLKAQFPNEDGGLFPNQFVNVRMLLDTRRGATLVPSAAVVRGGQGTFVYVINEDQTVALRKVNVGIAEADSVSVESGLAPGERVVVEGSDRLRDGAKVEIPDRAASATPGKSGKAPRNGEGKRRRFSDHAAVQPGLELGYSRAGSAGGDQRGLEFPPRVPARAARLQQGESGRRAYPYPRHQLEDDAAAAGAEPRRYAPCTEDLA